MVMPYYEGLSLNKFVEKYLKNNEKLENKKIYQILGNLVGTLQALSDSFNVSHKDLNPENIFIKDADG